MQNDGISLRDRIRSAAEELLNEINDADKITVRQIADRASVGVGLVNYHFGSKEALLAELVAAKMTEIVRSSETVDEDELSPKERLRLTLTRLYDFGAENLPLIRYMIRSNIEKGEMGSALSLVPFLRDVFPKEYDEMSLRIIAIQILYPLQLTGLAPEQFKLYSGIDILDAQARARFVNQLIDNLL